MRPYVLVAAMALLASCSRTETPPSLHAEVQAQAEPVPNFYQSARDAMPFPKILSALSFQDPKARRVYAIAASIPAVLAQQPCYCHCDRGHGHKGLLDCHRDAHSAG